MRDDHQHSDMYRYLSPEQRMRATHPLRKVRDVADDALKNMSERFSRMYAKTGRPSIAPEKLLHAQLIQMLSSVPSERSLMKRIDYSLLYRWFVGMNLDDPMWDVTVFTKNPNRLLEGVRRHFTLDGSVIEAWASLKSFRHKGENGAPLPDAANNSTVNFQARRAVTKRTNRPRPPRRAPAAVCRRPEPAECRA